jgi:hypothetical protein
MRYLLAGWAAAAACGLLLGADAADATALRFEVTAEKGLLAAPQDGRVLVVLARDDERPPRFSIGETGLRVPPVLGQDARAFDAGKTVVLDASSSLYPLKHLARLPRGEYVAQAVFDYNRDLRIADAPDNLVSLPVKVTLDPARGGVVKLVLSRKLPADEPPKGTAQVKLLKLRSEKLSKFHGRPMYLRAGVILPAGHAEEPARRYPLRVVIGGFGSRYTAVLRMMQNEGFARRWNAADGPRMILLHLDGAGPLGDPYQVNSANNGPYGDAVTQELIPHVEKTYRGIGKGWARVLEGASTGGWVSLALQVFYPDFFNGAWSHCPDPVDFRAFELINIYRDANAYVNARGFERPSAREINGDVRFTVRNEVARETTLGRGNRWTLSGKDWGSWNAVFGGRGPDGLPVPLWDGQTGAIDRKAAAHYEQYDLRLRLQKYAAALAPKLRGKLHVWVGEADDYFLNNAVHLLDDFVREARPAFDAQITYGPRGGHSWRGISERRMTQEMAAAVERGKKAAGE